MEIFLPLDVPVFERMTQIASTSLAAGIYRDYDAVYGALETSYSNGQTEAQVHRLKLIKRQVYGRASFDQLRLRVLHGSGVTYQEKLRVEHSSQQKCV